MIEIIEILDSPPCSPNPSLCKTSEGSHSYDVPIEDIACQQLPPSFGRSRSEPVSQRSLPDRSKISSPTVKQVESTSRTVGSRTRPPLKIVLVDSRPYRKSDRLRQGPKKLSDDNDKHASNSDPFEDDAGLAADIKYMNNSEDSSDEEYNDEAGRPPKRRRKWQKRPRIRKRHGKLGPADKELIMRAEKGRPMYEAQKPCLKRLAPLDNENAGVLAERLISKVDWDKVAAATANLQISRPDLGSDGEIMTGGRQDTEACLRLKAYWLDVLTKAVKDLNMNELA